MHLIEVAPVACCVCGKGNTPDAHGDRARFIDFERDINWNDPLIMCEDCVAQAGGTVGMASKDVLEGMKHEVRLKDKEVHEIRAKMDSMQRRARRLGISFEKATA